MEQTLAPDAAAPRTGSEIELMDLLGYVYLQNNRPDKAAVLLAARDVLAPDHPRTLLTLALAQVRGALESGELKCSKRKVAEALSLSLEEVDRVFQHLLAQGVLGQGSNRHYHLRAEQG